MAVSNTYQAIATTTLGSGQTSYTFSSIASTYTDLILSISNYSFSSNDCLVMRFNSDSTSNYSQTEIYGNGTSAASGRDSGTKLFILDNFVSNVGGLAQSQLHIMNYANTTTYKTVLERSGNSSTYTLASVGLWRKTPEAINSITILTATGGNIPTGTILNLYGIAAA